MSNDSKNSKTEPEDLLIEQAFSVLKDHLKNHPNREGISVGYRIEQAINLLRDAHRICLERYTDKQ